jgi:hypothetical protein
VDVAQIPCPPRGGVALADCIRPTSETARSTTGGVCSFCVETERWIPEPGGVLLGRVLDDLLLALQFGQEVRRRPA